MSATEKTCFEALHLAVLIVEDNPVNRMVAQRMLDKFGCDHETVENGAEALAAIDRRLFDIVLMDCSMPVMDGYQATEELRRRHYARPIVALTANGDEDRCREVGMDDFITKPVRPRELFDVLQRHSAAA